MIERNIKAYKEEYLIPVHLVNKENIAPIYSTSQMGGNNETKIEVSFIWQNCFDDHQILLPLFTMPSIYLFARSM